MLVSQAIKKLNNPTDIETAENNFISMMENCKDYERPAIEQAFNLLWDLDRWPDISKPKETKKTPAEIYSIIDAIKDLPGLETEICGTWLWVGGSTKQHRAILKNLGLKYARKKQKWYWRPAGYKKRGRKVYSMPEIRHMHGSKEIED